MRAPAAAAVLLFVALTLTLTTHAQEQRTSYDRANVSLVIINRTGLNISVKVFYKYDDCYECSLYPDPLLNETHTQTTVNTNFGVTLNTASNVSEFQTTIDYQFGEHGVYELRCVVTSTDITTYVHEVVAPNPNPQAPIGWAALILFCVGVAYLLALRLYRQRAQRSDYNSSPPYSAAGALLMPRASAVEEATEHQKKQRVESLDAFRGLALTIMIFVNYNGGGYWFFNHSTWNGLTVADLVFPWFIWIMGTAMAISFHSLRRRRQVPPMTMVAKIARRAAILFALGLVVSNSGANVTFGNLRIMGVLQRFGVTYFVVALIIAFSPDRQQSRGSPLAVLLNHWTEWLWIGAVVILHCALTFGLNVPGCGRGYLGAGGLADASRYQQCTGGAAGYIDRQILGTAHLYQTPTCQQLYRTGPYDPEGLLGCLTSIIMCFLGVQAGRCIVYFQKHQQRLTAWLGWCVVVGAIGCALCGGRQNGGLIPVNKNLWSMSFVTVLSSMAFALLSVFYLLIDVYQVWNGAPWLYPGKNSIVVYFGSELLQMSFPFTVAPNSGVYTHASMLATNICGVALWVAIAFTMFRNGVMIKI